MRLLTNITVSITALTLALTSAAFGANQASDMPRLNSCKASPAQVQERRNATWHWQAKLDVSRTPTSYFERKTTSCAYLTYLRKKWSLRADRSYSMYRAVTTKPVFAIRFVFGAHADEAIRVSWCESRHSVWAQNGQYLGLFQMGSYERRTFGHGSDPYAQARAAHRYFVLTGRDWSPWSCKPWYAS